jgi:hypothetical protein
MNAMSAVGTASSDRVKEETNSLVFNYKKLRTVVGILGISLPFTTGLGAWLVFHTGLQGSISSYYYTGLRDVFVGTLWAIGFFLVAYKGYSTREDWSGNLACLFAVLISIFPTTPESSPSAAAVSIGYVHTGSAAFFFGLLAYFAFQFTSSDQPYEQQTPEKRRRNVLYKLCGYILAGSLVLIVVAGILPATLMEKVAAFKPVYVLETVAILAFGISWLVKGEAIMGDKPAVSTLSQSTGTA